MDTIEIKKQDGFQYQRLISVLEEVRAFCVQDSCIKNLFVTDIGFFPNANHHFRQRPNGCDEYIIIFCVDGKGYYTIGDKPPVILPKNHILILPRKVAHAYWASVENPWSIYFFHISGEMADTYFNRMERFDFALNHDFCARFIEIFEECYNCLRIEEVGSLLMYASKVAEHMVWFLVMASSEDMMEKMKRNTAEEKVVGIAIKYMRSNLYNQLTLQDICDHANFSPSHFTKLFRKATGYPPVEYFLRLKMQASCDLLESTDLSIKEISYRFKYYDPFYFSRLFKKYIGKSPQEYRKQFRMRMQ